jgi:hypothetical protein
MPIRLLPTDWPTGLQEKEHRESPWAHFRGSSIVCSAHWIFGPDRR